VIDFTASSAEQSDESASESDEALKFYLTTAGVVSFNFYALRFGC
jgi:hypothetical protein